jgi:hypothetical protein
MRRTRPTAYRAFRTLADPALLPRLALYQGCTCGSCFECRDNARWDRVFAKFEVKEPDVRGLYRCAIADL